MKYIISQEQMQIIINLISECPIKTGMPVIEYLKTIINGEVQNGKPEST